MHEDSGRFYFALPRLLAVCSGQSAARSEKNWMEAYFSGMFFFLVIYAAIGASVSPRAWIACLVWLSAAAFISWIVWLLILYVNSVAIAALRTQGLFGGMSNSRAQNVVIGLELTILAAALLRRGDWSYFVAVGWIAATILNMCAAALLAVVRPRASQ